MRGFKYSLPHNMADSSSASPLVVWLILSLIFAGGVAFIIKGAVGIKNKRIRGKWGRVFEGTTAQILGVIWIAVGASICLITIATGLVATL